VPAGPRDLLAPALDLPGHLSSPPFVVLRTAHDFFPVAGPEEFVRHAVGGDVTAARRAFEGFAASDPPVARPPSPGATGRSPGPDGSCAAQQVLRPLHPAAGTGARPAGRRGWR
jgi:hypothetical protein